MKLLKQAVKYFVGIWLAQIRLTVCIVLGIMLLLFLLLACDARFLTKQEMLNIMTRCYGQEFAVLSSRSLGEAERADDVWRVRVYEMCPVEEPERQFWAFNIISAESGGIWGASNGVCDSYTVDIMVANFEELAEEAGLTYEVTYRSYPALPATGYYSSAHIEIEFNDLAALSDICAIIAQSLTDTLALLPEDFDYSVDTDFFLKYCEDDWPKDKFYRDRIQPFAFAHDDNRFYRAISAADIEAEFMEGLNEYMEKEANRQ